MDTKLEESSKPAEHEPDQGLIDKTMDDVKLKPEGGEKPIAEEDGISAKISPKHTEEEDDLEEGELRDDDDDDDDDGDNSDNCMKRDNGNAIYRDSDDSLERPKSSADSSQRSRKRSGSTSSSKSSSSKTSAKSDKSTKSSKHEKSSSSRSRSSSRSSTKSSSRRNRKRSASSDSSSPIRSRRTSTDESGDISKPAEEKIGLLKCPQDSRDPTEKAAQMIIMRTRLLEQRAREIEMRFQKKPPRSISNSFEIKGPRTPPPDSQGPRTPPENQVLNLRGRQIDWPSHLIKMTTSKPSIPFSVNPDSSKYERIRHDSKRTKVEKEKDRERDRDRGRDKYHKHERSDRKHDKEHKHEKQDQEDRHSKPTTPVSDIKVERLEHPEPVNPTMVEPDLNADYNWYYNYFVNHFEMDHNQAQHQAFYSVISNGNHEQAVVDKWLESRGYTTKSIMELKPRSKNATQVEESLRIVTRISRHRHIRDTEAAEPVCPNIAHDSCPSQATEPVEPQSVPGALASTKSETDISSAVQEIVSHEPSDPAKDRPCDTKVLSSEIKMDDLTVQETESGEHKADKPSVIKDEVNSEGPAPSAASSTYDPLAPHPIHPKITIIKSQKEIVLPNGHVLPAGTVQKVVHPFLRVDSEVYGPLYDLYS